MHINYFTLVAQIINFLILFLLLRHFLYPPIIKAMDEREKRIASQLKQVEEDKKKASAAEASYRKMQQEMTDKRDEYLAQAKVEADKSKKALMSEARKQLIDEKNQWHQAIEHEKNDYLASINEHVADGMINVVRHALQDLAGDELNHRIIHTFLERLKHLKAIAHQETVQSSGTSFPAVITSAFKIDQETRQLIAREVGRLLGGKAVIKYNINPELISGIELSTGYLKVSWSLAEYMDEFRKKLTKEIENDTAK
jgi:F-type H+-transporting ATPase subunit b